MSLFDEYPCINKTFAPNYVSYSTAAISVPLSFLAIFGNLFVILAVTVDPNKELKGAFNHFVANLAVADLLVGLIVLPVSVWYHIVEGLEGRYAADPAYLHMAYFVSCTASILSLGALTVDRYVAIAYPLKYRLRLSPRRAVYVSVGIWVFSISFPFIYFRVGFLAFAFVFANTAVVFTLAVIIFTYIRIFGSFREQVRYWDGLNQSIDNNQAKRQAVRWEQKLTKTLLIVLIFFFSCYVTSCILIYVANLCTECSCVSIHFMRDAQFVLISSNSSINPYIYAFRLQNFQNAFKSLLTCQYCGRRFVCNFSCTESVSLRHLRVVSSTSSDKEIGQHNNI